MSDKNILDKLILDKMILDEMLYSHQERDKNGVCPRHRSGCLYWMLASLFYHFINKATCIAYRDYSDCFSSGNVAWLVQLYHQSIHLYNLQ